MTDTREPIPPEMIKRIREVGANCVLAGLTTEETIDALNIEARKHGMEYRMRRQ